MTLRARTWDLDDPHAPRPPVPPPEGMEVGHINGDGLDNRRENLRVATRKMNSRNRVRQKPNRKYPLPMGVYPKRRRFLARIVQDGRSRCLGKFTTPEEASAAYQAARRESVEAAAPTELLLHTAG